MSKSIRDRFVVWLTGHNWTRIHTHRSTKYWVFKNPDVEDNVYLGRAGAFRYGRSIAHSVPLSEARRQKILSAASM